MQLMQPRGSEADLGWMRQFLRWQTSLKLNDLKKAAALMGISMVMRARGYPILTPVCMCVALDAHTTPTLYSINFYTLRRGDSVEVYHIMHLLPLYICVCVNTSKQVSHVIAGAMQPRRPRVRVHAAVSQPYNYSELQCIGSPNCCHKV